MDSDLLWKLLRQLSLPARNAIKSVTELATAQPNILAQDAAARDTSLQCASIQVPAEQWNVAISSVSVIISLVTRLKATQ